VDLFYKMQVTFGNEIINWAVNFDWKFNQGFTESSVLNRKIQVR